MTAVIETRGLTKHFGTTVALDGLDLCVEEGTVHGFLDFNGAGKSTTIRILLGLLRATGGRARLFGQDPWRDAVDLHRQLAYVPGDVTLWPNLTGGEAIPTCSPDCMAAMTRGVAPTCSSASTSTRRRRVGPQGQPAEGRPRRGARLRPPLLLLDEPTSGLDPLMERVFQEEIVRVRDEGRTVLLSSHILSEVEKACSVVSIVRAGTIVDSGSLTALRHLGHTHVVATYPDGHTETADLEPSEVAGWVAARPGLASLTATPPTLEELFLARYESGAPTR